MLFNIEPLRMWVHKVLPVVYDDSLSYYEVLAKTVRKLNEVIDLTDEQTKFIQEFSDNLTEAINEWEKGVSTEWTNYKKRIDAEWENYKSNTNEDIEIWKHLKEVEIERAVAEGIYAFAEYFEGLKNQAVDAADRAVDEADRAEAAADEAAENAVEAVMPTLEGIFDNRYAFKSAVGSPLVAHTAAEMTDTNKIYVYVGDETGYVSGNWYYYDGTAWTSGGVYNSAGVVTDTTLTQSGVPADAKVTGDEITDLKSAVNPLVYLPIDETAFTSGYYVWSDGKAYTNSNYTLSPYLRCAFKRIKFNCLTSGGSIQSVAFYSGETEASFLGGHENTASLSTYPVYEMDVPDGTKYIRISKNAKSQYTKSVTPWVMSTETGEHISERIDAAQGTADEALYKVEHIDPVDILSEVYNEVYSDVNLIPSTGLIEHAYLKNDGEIKTITNTASADYVKCVSGYIPVIPGRIVYMPGDNFMYSQFFGFYDESKTYIGGKDTYLGFAYSNHVANHLIPSGAAYLRVTFYTTADAASAWAGYTGAQPTGEVINASNIEYLDYHYFPTNPCDFIGRDIAVFNKIACIGDSITSGYFNTSGGGQSIAKYSYPTFLQKITGVTCTNLGDAGETSVSWWSAHSGDDFSGYDCAIINLGINDALYSVSESDTRTAFGNIISALKTANTGIKIFLASVTPAYSRGNTTYDAINAIIEDIADDTTDCYFVDLTEYGHSNGVGYVNGHLTAAGYWMMAQDLASAISYIIRNKPLAFRFVQFIGTDLHN